MHILQHLVNIQAAQQQQQKLKQQQQQSVASSGWGSSSTAVAATAVAAVVATATADTSGKTDMFMLLYHERSTVTEFLASENETMPGSAIMLILYTRIFAVA
jgi:hypothetical protein